MVEFKRQNKRAKGEKGERDRDKPGNTLKCRKQ